MLDGDLRLSVVGVDHDDGRRLMLKNAYRDLLVAITGAMACASVSMARSRRTGTRIVETCTGQRLCSAAKANLSVRSLR